MTIRNGDVRPGKCFSNQADDAVRRVVAVRDGAVAYEQRGRKVTSGNWPIRSEMPLPDFLADAGMEVGCDYSPRNASGSRSRSASPFHLS